MTYKYLRSAGDFDYTDRLGNTISRKNGDFTSHSLFARTNWSEGLGLEGKSLSLSAQVFHSDGGNPGNIDQPNPIARKKNTTESANIIFERKLFTVYDHLQVQGFVHNSEFRYDDDYQYVPIHSYDHNMAFGAEAQSQVIVVPWMTVTAGYAFRYDLLFNTGSLGEQHRTTHGVYGQAELGYAPPDSGILKRLLLIPAIRWDDFSDFGGEISPKISLLLSLGEEWQVSLKSNYGYSFRAPSFNDLYWPRDAWTIGNPDLKPESGHDFDAGVLMRLPALRELALDLTYYHNTVRDMIVWLQGQTLWSPENIGQATLRGIESKVGVSPVPGLLRLEWDYTYLDSRDETDNPNEKGNVLPYRPKHHQNFQATLTVWDFALTGTVAYTSSVYTNVANTTSLPDYYTAGATAGYTLPLENGSLGIRLEGKNLGNSRYEVMEGFPMPGREIRLSAEYRFQQLLSSQ